MPAEDTRSVEIDGYTWRTGDYCMDRTGRPYKVINVITAGGDNTVGFESPPGSGSVFYLDSPYFEVLRPLRMIDADATDALMAVWRAWAYHGSRLRG